MVIGLKDRQNGPIRIFQIMLKEICRPNFPTALPTLLGPSGKRLCTGQNMSLELLAKM